MSTYNENEAATRNEREAVYGDAHINHKGIAGMWQGILENHFQEELPGPIPAHLIPLMMAGLKVNRLARTPDHADSHHDAHVYLKLTEEVLRKENEKLLWHPELNQEPASLRTASQTPRPDSPECPMCPSIGLGEATITVVSMTDEAPSPEVDLCESCSQAVRQALEQPLPPICEHKGTPSGVSDPTVRIRS